MATKGAQVSNLISDISRLIDSGEYNHSPYDFIEARRLLNNQLPQLIDDYVKEECGKNQTVPEADRDIVYA
jgi:hypothetical protein